MNEFSKLRMFIVSHVRAFIYRLHEETTEAKCLFYAIPVVAFPVSHGVIIFVGRNSTLGKIQYSMVLLNE